MRARKICFALLGLAVCAIAGPQQVGPPVLQTARNLPIPVDDDALRRQFAALSSMPKAEVQYSKRGPVAYVRGDLGMVLTGTSEDDITAEVWSRLKDLFLAVGTETLHLEDDGTDLFYRYVTFSEKIRGIPIVRSSVKLQVDKHTGRVLEIGAGFVPDRGLPKRAKLTAEQAQDGLRASLERSLAAKKGTVIFGTSTLAYLAMHERKPAQLVWESTSFIYGRRRKQMGKIHKNRGTFYRNNCGFGKKI